MEGVSRNVDRTAELHKAVTFVNCKAVVVTK